MFDRKKIIYLTYIIRSVKQLECIKSKRRKYKLTKKNPIEKLHIRTL